MARQPWRRVASLRRARVAPLRKIARRRRLLHEPLEPRRLLATTPLITEFMAINDAGLADQDGELSDWIEIHNPTAQSVSLQGWLLTDDANEPGKWTFPAVSLEPGAYRVVFASGKDRADPAAQLHTNFKLDGGGEYLALVRPDHSIVHEYAPDFPSQYADVSYGLAMNASGVVIEPLQVGYHLAATPGVRNGAVLLGFVEEPEVSVERGFFEAPFAMEITTATAGAAVYYTTDGTVPTPTNGALYHGPVQVTTTTVLRAGAFRDGYLSSTINTQTYLFLEDVIRQSNGGSLDGLFSTLEIPGTTSLGTQFTLAAYVDFSEGKFVRLFSAYQGTGTVLEGRVLVDLDPSGTRLPGGFRFMIGGHGSAQTASVPAVLKQSGYHHVAVTYNNGAVAAYIDGVALTLTGTITGGSITSPVNLRFGEDPHDGGGTSAEPYHGRVDEIFVLGRAMSQAEIVTIAASGVLGNVTPLPTQRAVLYDFEGDYGTTITDKFTADGAQNGLVHNAVTVSSAAGNARFGTSGGWFEDPDAAEPELPTTWGSATADYEMDPNVVNQLPYSQTILDDLKAIPTMSLVLDLDDMFGPSGIYSNPTQTGMAWERPVSAEFFDSNGDRQFQIDAGVRIHGGSTRRPDITPQHSFRLCFRSEYGASKLEFPLFERTNTSTFDKLVLDAGSSDTWTSANTATGEYGQFIRDQWARDTHIAMGHEGPDGTFAHLYINGLYWGIYNVSERVDEGFAAEHFGGSKDEYDVIFGEQTGPEVQAGTITVWNALLARARAGDYAGVLELLDIDCFIDYMIVNMFTGNWDWPHHNWCAMRRQAAGEQFKLVVWDCEVGMGLTRAPILPHSLTVDMTGASSANGPGEIYSLLSQNAEFRLRFADRLQKHFFNGGVLSPERAIAIYDARAEEIEAALVAESARWGDVRREPPDVPDGTWLAERNWIESTFFPQRPAVVLGQFRARGLFPNINAPALRINGIPQHGGQIDSGDLLSLTSAAGTTIYYTLDGSDPRSSSTTSTATTLVATEAPKRALVPSVANGGSTLGTLWTGGSESAFAAAGGDAAWASGTLGVGYDKDPDFLPYLGINVQSQMTGTSGNNSVFVRVPFTADESTIASTDTLTLKMKYDDGFVAYLNGQEVTRASFAGTPQWDSRADFGHESQGFESFDISTYLYLLQPGQNILAIHGLNRSTDSSDMIVLPVLEAATSSGSGSNVYTGPIPLEHGVLVKARARSGDTWSALIEAQFFVVAPADASNLAITEINYNPYPPTTAEKAAYAQRQSDDFEFIELRNTSDQAVDLTGVALTDGITFTFADGTILGPGAFLVLARNLVAFQTRYPSAAVPAGQYDGNLGNGGEQIVLVDFQGEEIHNFEYDNSGDWPNRADGNGSSLELIDPSGDYGDPDNWCSSAEWGGSPGAAPKPPDVVVNEVFSHSSELLTDAIELVNMSDRPIDVGGWYLSDSLTDLRKFRIPDDTVIPAGGYLVFDEDDFGGGAGWGGFALDAEGDDVWLLETDYQGDPTRFADHVEFGAAAAGESFGRWPDGTGVLYPMAYRTLGATNSGPRVGPVIYSEIQYNPGTMLGANDLEFVEIYNPTDQPVDLTGWRIRKGIDFDFEPGTILPAGGTLTVVPFDPEDSADPASAAKLAAFRAQYGVTQAIAMAGPYTGKLDNGGERVQLQRPDELGSAWLLVDEVRYDDLAPWPAEADGSGSSLQREATLAWGPDVESWGAATPTPGSFLPGPEVIGRYVFYNHSKFDDPASGGSDDSAIAPAPSGLVDPWLGKTPLLAGRTATVMNYTSYSRGINGIMIDVAAVPGGRTPGLGDFEFRVGNDSDPADWPAAPTPLSISVEAGAGLHGADRVTIIWADGAIRNQWLQVRILSDALGLADDDIFYWGSAVGESGDSAENALVNATDLVAVRNNLRGPLAPAAITDPYDVDRDGLVNATDMALVRDNMTSPLGALRLITPLRQAQSGSSQPARLVPLFVGPVPRDPMASPRTPLAPLPRQLAQPPVTLPNEEEPAAASRPIADALPARLAVFAALGQMAEPEKGTGSVATIVLALPSRRAATVPVPFFDGPAAWWVREKGTGSVVQPAMARGETLLPRCVSPSPTWPLRPTSAGVDMLMALQTDPAAGEPVQGPRPRRGPRWPIFQADFPTL